VRERVRLRRIYIQTLERLHKQVKKTKDIWKQETRVVRVPITSLTAIQGTVDSATVVKYAKRINYPAITVVKTRCGLFIWDGHHRVQDLLERGLKDVKAEIFEINEWR
jgi:hypothetical protein